jgi:hypothetical protein
MTITLKSGHLTEDVAMPAKAGWCKVATTGTWSGTLTLTRTINGATAVYTDGVYTENDDFWFSPGTDFTTFTLDGTGTVHITFTRVDNPNS